MWYDYMYELRGGLKGKYEYEYDIRERANVG